MPTLLRLLIAMLATVTMFAGCIVLALGLTSAATVSGALLFLGVVALTAVALPPILVGTFVSVWSWDASARRRLRIAVGVLAGVQLAGIGGLVALLIAVPTMSLLGVLVVIALAVAEYPIAIALGRVARRIEVRAPVPPVASIDAALITGIRSGWRRLGVGTMIGVVAGLAIFAATTIGFGDGARALRFAFIVPAAAGMGLAVAGLRSTLPLATTVRNLLGGDASTARRIGRAVQGKPEVLTDDEADRAARYARVAPAWVNLQLATNVGSLVVSMAVVTNVAFTDHNWSWALAVFVGVILTTVALTFVLRSIRNRRMRDYAEAHPVVD